MKGRENVRKNVKVKKIKYTFLHIFCERFYIDKLKSGDCIKDWSFLTTLGEMKSLGLLNSELANSVSFYLAN